MAFWYRVTWLGAEPTYHPILGTFPRRGSSQVVPLSPRDVTLLRASRVKQRKGSSDEHQDVAAWRVERLPEHAGSRQAPALRLRGRRDQPWQPPNPETLVLVDAVLKIEGVEKEIRLPLSVIAVEAGGSVRRQLRDARSRLARALTRNRDIQTTLREVIQRSRADFRQWSRRQDLPHTFEAYHALSQGGRPRKLSREAVEELRVRRPDLSQAARARVHRVSRRTLARSEARHRLAR
jgi:hypothetical protein